MSMHQRICVPGLAAFSLLLSGCHSTSTTGPRTAYHALGNGNLALVMLPSDSEAIAGEFGGWEDSRRDNDLGVMNPPLQATVGIAVTRQYENLGISNGQSQGGSWTYNRSVKARVGP